jgi:hypothetical protein
VSVADAALTPTGSTIAASEGLAFSGSVASFTDADPNGTAGDYMVTIDWGDGSTPTIGTIASVGAGFVVNGSHSYAEEGSYPVTVAIMDQGGSKATANSTATVVVVQPKAGCSGPSNGVPGQPRTFTFTANDVDPTDQVAGFIYTINWGDGSAIVTIPRTVGNGSGVTLDHIFTLPGVYPVTVTATEDGGSSGTAGQAVTVQTVQMQGNSLAVGGNPTGGDDIVLFPVDASHTISVTINHVSWGNFLPTDHIFIYGQGPNEKISLRSSGSGNGTLYVTVPAFVYGEGSGGDKINVSGSAANNVLVGHGTNEVLIGGLGSDLLIGGTGSATLNAGLGDDILIGGWTDYDIFTLGVSALPFDAKVKALEAIMAEWGSTDSYTARVNKVQAGIVDMNGLVFVNAGTVHNSLGVDSICGYSKANDWFLAGIEDLIAGFQSGEVMTLIN